MAEKSNFQPENYSLGTLFWDMTDPTVRFLADTSEGLISTLGLDGSILYTNAAWSAQLGYSATEALELNLLDVLHPDSHDHCKDLLEDLISGRGTASYEATFTAKDGAPHRLQGTALPAVVDGVVVGVVSLLEMISHDGREVPVLKDLLGANGALLKLATQAIMETSLDALLIMDHHGRILDINGAAESMFGHKRGDVLGRLMGDVIVPLSMREAHANGLKRFLGSREPKVLGQRLRLSALRADGTEFPVELAVSQIPANEPPVFAGAIRDITSQVEYERELNSAVTEADEANTEFRASQSQLRASYLETLNTFALSLIHPTTVDEILWEVARHPVAQLGFEDCVVYLLDEESGRLVQIAAHGAKNPVADEIYNPITIAVGEGVVGSVVRSGRSELVRDTRTDPRYITDDLSRRSELAVPIVRDGKVIGVVDSEHPDVDFYTEDHRQILTTIASIASTKIGTALALAELTRANDELLTERETLAERVDERTADLSAANAELSRAARSKDEFLASMSHELRTPLNAILGSAESLEEGIYGELDVKQRRPIEMIDESGRHLLSLINDILDLSKVQAGMLELELESIVPQEIAEGSLRFIREAALKKRLNISTQFDHSIETVHADGRRLKQILVNLLSNAVKFTPEGGNVGLEYVADPEREAVYFVVWDSGMGISREGQQKLFAPFVQLDAGLDREFSGTGLGLALVSRMTELHGGSVSVESPGVGEGTRFTVSLPWEAPTVVRNPTEGTGAGGEPEAAIEELDPPLGGAAPLVLLAEDNEVTIEVMSAVLQAKGYRLIVARNGQEAVDRAKEESPDLILMDVQMPVMDGIEATRQIRDITELASTPIIIVTAVAMDGDRERCLATGANEYLSKPVSLKNLTATIERLIRRES